MERSFWSAVAGSEDLVDTLLVAAGGVSIFPLN